MLLAKDNYFFRFQVGVPCDGDIEKLELEICHKYAWYQANPDGTPDHSLFEGELPGVKILALPAIPLLEELYPGITKAIILVQTAAIMEGIKLLNPPEPSEPPIESQPE